MSDSSPINGALGFEEVARFFRGKINVPTTRWSDLWGKEHDYGFMVAGARKAELLADLRTMVEQALAGRITKAEFSKQFYAIAEKHGWSYYERQPGWRASLVYTQNMLSAYAAGRYEQLTDPDTLEAFPYWEYLHIACRHPRPVHVSWSGTVLEASDPWWGSHYPPNGYLCHCKVCAVSETGLARRGKSRPDRRPTPVDSPEGVGKGFGYAPGASRLTPQAKVALANGGSPPREASVEKLTPGDWQSAGRPQKLTPVPAEAMPVAPATSRDEAVKMAEQALGGADKVFHLPGCDYPLAVSAEALIDHWAEGNHLSRSAWLPLLPQLLTRPQEIWAGFERPKLEASEAAEVKAQKTPPPRAEFSLRLLSSVKLPGRDKLLFLVSRINAHGLLTAITMFTDSNQKYMDKQRWGRLLHVDDGPVP